MCVQVCSPCFHSNLGLKLDLEFDLELDLQLTNRPTHILLFWLFRYSLCAVPKRNTDNFRVWCVQLCKRTLHVPSHLWLPLSSCEGLLLWLHSHWLP